MATVQDFSFFQGEDTTFTIEMSPKTNITGWYLEFRAIGPENNGFIRKVSGLGITVTDVVNGIFTITINANDTLNLLPSTWWWDVRRTDVASQGVLSGGCLYVLPSVTPTPQILASGGFDALIEVSDVGIGQDNWAIYPPVGPVIAAWSAVDTGSAGDSGAVFPPPGGPGLFTGVSGAFNCPIAVNVGDCVYLASSDTVDQASAASPATMPAIGFVSSKVSPTQCIVQYFGELTTFGGLALNTGYYVGLTPGQIVPQSAAPLAPGQVLQRVGEAKNASTLYIDVEVMVVNL